METHQWTLLSSLLENSNWLFSEEMMMMCCSVFYLTSFFVSLKRAGVVFFI
jgi:hypothetical protein